MALSPSGLPANITPSPTTDYVPVTQRYTGSGTGVSGKMLLRDLVSSPLTYTPSTTAGQPGVWSGAGAMTPATLNAMLVDIRAAVATIQAGAVANVSLGVYAFANGGTASGSTATATSGLGYLTAGTSGAPGGNVLTDASGNVYVPRTIDWYGMESPILIPNGLDQRPYKTITVGGVIHIGILDQIKAMGFNGIRFGVCQDVTWSTNGSPADWTTSNGRRCTTSYMAPDLNPDFFTSTTYNSTTGAPYAVPQPVISSLQILDKIAAYAGSIGLRIILDMHCLAPSASDHTGNSRTSPIGTEDDGTNLDPYATGEPGAGQENWVVTKLWYTTVNRTDTGMTTGAACEYRNEAQAIAAWVAFVTYFKNRPEICGCDIINEPAGGTWATTDAAADLTTDLCSYYERVGAAIQAVNPGVLIVCEGPSSWRPGYSIDLGPIATTAAGDHSNDVYLYPGFSSALMNVASRPVTLSIAGKVVYSPHEYGSQASYGDGITSLTAANQAAWNVTAKGYSKYYQYDPTFPANMPAVWRAQWGFIAEQMIAPLWVGETGADLTCDVTTPAAGWGVSGTTNTVEVPLEWPAGGTGPTTATACTYSTANGTGTAGSTFTGVTNGTFTWPAGALITTVPVTMLATAVAPCTFQISFAGGGQSSTSTVTLVNSPNNVTSDQKWLTELNTYLRQVSGGFNWFAAVPDGPGAPLGLVSNTLTATGAATGPWATSGNAWQMAYVTPMTDAG